MDQATAITVFQQMLLVTFLISIPMLGVGLIVGLLISIFEAVTTIREMTLTFIPKIIAVGAVLFLTLPWILTKVSDFTIRMFELMKFLP